MTKTILVLAIALSSIAVMSAQELIKINTEKSIVKWTGYNLFKYNRHFGTVKFKEGSIHKNNGVIVGGDFVIDMTSIMNTDGKYNEMLVSHLKGSDFFDVKKHPVSKLKFVKFKRTSESDGVIEADLTIMGITNYIKFRCKLNKDQDTWQLSSKFFIDRTRWGIKYESKSLLGGIKDDIISDAIEFEVVVEWLDNVGC